MADGSGLKITDVKSLFFFLLAYWSWKNGKTPSVLPDILGVMDLDDVIKFTTIFGGRTVRIPSFPELADEMNEAIAAYLVHCEGCSHDYIQGQILKIGPKRYNKMSKRIDQWGMYMKDFMAERQHG